MSKFRKHSIEEKRRRSKVRKQRKKLARKYSENCSDPEVTAREPLVSMQNHSAENGGQDDDNSSGKQPSHWNEMQTVMRLNVTQQMLRFASRNLLDLSLSSKNARWLLPNWWTWCQERTREKSYALSKTTKQKNTENADTYSKTIIIASIYYLKLMLSG